jgi:hypothetical protein
MIAGCLIDINKDEIAVVDSIERVMLPSGEIQWDLVLDEGVISPYLKNTTITLRAFPAVLRRAVKVGDTSIVVDSPYNLVPGDKFFTVSRPELIPVASPMTMMTAVESQMQIYASVHRWSATTEINHMEIASDSVIYVEANIGYKSTKLQLPDMSGPYIADVFGGKTFGSSKDDITLSVKFFGAENKVSVVKPNEVVVSLPVRAGDLALWSFERGSCSVLSQDAVDIKLDNNGCAGLAHEMPIKAPVILELDIDRASRVWTEADDEKTEERGPGLFKSTSECRTIKLCIVGVPNDVVRITTNSLRLNYRAMVYSYCSRTKSQESWAGGSLILKPLMRQLNDLLADSDDGDYLNVNNGGLVT